MLSLILQRIKVSMRKLSYSTFWFNVNVKAQRFNHFLKKITQAIFLIFWFQTSPHIFSLKKDLKSLGHHRSIDQAHETKILLVILFILIKRMTERKTMSLIVIFY